MIKPLIIISAWVTAFVFTCCALGADVGIPIKPEAKAEIVNFHFDASSLKAKPTRVNIVGTLDNWSHDNTPMHDDGNGMYSVSMELEPGLYHYKFLVDGEQWFEDPSSDKELADKADHNNSGVIVGLDARKLPAPVPGEIQPLGLAHDPSSEIDANVASTSLLRLRLRTQEDNVQTINAWFATDEHPQWQQAPLWPIDRHLGFESYGGTITPNGLRARYFFELIDGSTKKYLASSMLYSTIDAAQAHPYIRAMQPTFETPDWCKHAVWYQIFVERFRNGDTSNDPPGMQRWQSKWYDTLPGEEPGSESFYTVNSGKRRYGGDIQGVQAELPYLRSLGINAIYLNPIFEADSSHKYDTRDYRHVDDYFGVKDSAAELTGETDDPATWKWSKSDLLFLNFVQEAHRQGFKVILDGVFNHVGKSNPFFQDVAKNGKASKYADWFTIFDWGNGGAAGKPGGLQYQAWQGRNGSLPIWKKDKQLGIVHGPREHLMDITRRWLAPDGDVSRGIDGFRLDAANEVPHPFWIEWRKFVKSINPDAYIDGEVWSWAQPWLSGDQFDAVMNYQFAMTTQSFFVDHKTALKPSAFSNRLEQLFYNYPLQVVLAQQNLFDSHDTDRFASRFLNPDRGYNRRDRLQEAGANYNAGRPTAKDWTRDRQAVAFQMCFAGAPMVYYGDEAGMWGPSDPSDRMPMWWKDLEPFDDPQCRFDETEFAWYQHCIAVRRQLRALQVGSFHPVLIDDKQGIYGFAREAAGQVVYVVLNRSATAANVQVPIEPAHPDARLVDWMNGEQVTLQNDSKDRPTLRVNSPTAGYAVENNKVSLSLPPYGAAVLAADESAH